MKTCRCGISLRNAVKIIASFEMILCIVALIPITLILLDICFGGKLGAFVELGIGVPRTVQFPICLAFWIIILVKFILDINLYRGANNNNYDAPLTWLTVTAFVLMTCYIWSLMSLNLFFTLRGCLTVLGVNILFGVYKGVEMVAVYKFMQNLKKLDNAHIFTTRATAPISITDFDFDNRTTRAKFSPKAQNNNLQQNTLRSHIVTHVCECDTRYSK